MIDTPTALTPSQIRLESFEAHATERPGRVLFTLVRGDGAVFVCEVESFLLDEIGAELRTTAIRSAPLGKPPRHETASLVSESP